MIREYKSLYQNRSFLIFWLGQSLSVTGDALAVLALPLLVLQATGSVVQMGLVTATFAAGCHPALHELFSPVGLSSRSLYFPLEARSAPV